MAKSSFNELFDLIYSENKKKKKEKGIKTALPFSKSKKAQLTQALINDPDYEIEVVKMKEGKFVTEKLAPVKDFRKAFIEKVLIDNGIDKAAAADAAKKYKYNLKQAEALYPVMAEDIESYMRLGYTYRFNDKRDFSGAIYMRDMPGGEKVNRDPKSGNKVTSKIDPHKVLVKKGGAPRICKHKV
jgi:hypothetical protein